MARSCVRIARGLRRLDVLGTEADAVHADGRRSLSQPADWREKYATSSATTLLRFACSKTQPLSGIRAVGGAAPADYPITTGRAEIADTSFNRSTRRENDGPITERRLLDAIALAFEVIILHRSVCPCSTGLSKNMRHSDAMTIQQVGREATCHGR